MRLSRRGAAVSSLVIAVALLPTIGSADRARALSTGRLIGCEGPLTGPSKVVGVNSCQAVELAVRTANRQGVLPYHLGVVRFDDRGDPVHGPAAAQQAIENPRVVAVVGPNFSGTALATGRRYAQAHMLVVTPSATYSILTKPSNKMKTFFQAIASDKAEGVAAGRYLVELPGIDRVAVVDDQSSYGGTVTRQVRRKLHAGGVAHFSQNLNGALSRYGKYAHEARRIVKRGADAVYYGGYDAQAGWLAKALHRAGFSGSFISDDGARSSVFITHAGKAAAASAQFTSPFVSDASYGPARKFARQYRHRFHVLPGEPAVEAFDATNSVIAALSKLPVSPTRADVVSAYRTINVRGIVNRMSFNHRHELRKPRIFLYRVSGRNIVQSHGLA